MSSPRSTTSRNAAGAYGDAFRAQLRRREANPSGRAHRPADPTLIAQPLFTFIKESRMSPLQRQWEPLMEVAYLPRRRSSRRFRPAGRMRYARPHTTSLIVLKRTR